MNQNIPSTFVIECNASQSTGQTGSNHEWTTILPEDLQLKRGDVVRINQAFCSSQGVGDLIDITNKVNSTRVVFEYYIQNDGMNDKVHQRRGLRKDLGTNTYIALPPLNHRPARVHRWGWCGEKRDDEYPSGVLPDYINYQVQGREDLYVPSLFRPPHMFVKTQSFVFGTGHVNLDKIQFWSKGTISPEGKIRAYPTIRGLSTGPADNYFNMNFLRKVAVGCAYVCIGETYDMADHTKHTGLNSFPFVIKSITNVNQLNYGTWEVECYMGTRDVLPVAPNTDRTRIGVDFFDFGGNGASPGVGVSTSPLSICCVSTHGVADRGDASKWRIFPNLDIDPDTDFHSYTYSYTQGVKSNLTNQHKQYTSDISRAGANITQTSGQEMTSFGFRENFRDNRFNRIRIGIRSEDILKALLPNNQLYMDVDNIGSYVDGGFVKLCKKAIGFDDADGEWCFYYKETNIPSGPSPDRVKLIRGLNGTTPRAFDIGDRIYLAQRHWGAYPRIKFSNMPTYIQGDYPNFEYEGDGNWIGGSCFLMDTDQITNTHADLRKTTFQINYTPIDVAGTSYGMRYWNSQAWLVHYGYKDLSVNKTYFSPSDLADEITNQLHKTEPVRKKGQANPPEFYENSAGSGFPQSKMLIPLLAPSKVNMVINGEELWATNVNTLVDSNGMLNGPYDVDTFCCKIYEEKGLFRMWGNKFFGAAMVHNADGYFSFTTQDDGGLVPDTWIWCWTSPSKTISYTRVKSLALSGGKPILMEIYQGQIPITDTEITYYQSTHPRIDTHEGNDLEWYLWLRNAQTPILTEENNSFTDKTTIVTADLKYAQYPQRYFTEGIPINDTGFGGYIDIDNMEFITQFCGASNPTLNWSTTLNRFQWTNLHQPFVTAFDTATKLGGDPACVIFVPGHKEMDNITRVGGVNIVNWSATQTEFKTYTTTLDADYEDPLLDLNRISADFWNTFGFSDTWLSENVGNTYYDTTNKKGYKPLGTTEAEIDSAEGIIATAEVTEDNPILAMTLNPPGSGSGEAVGGENLKGHNWGYGIPNTQGTPVIKSGATKSNPDAEAKKYYEVQVDSGYLTADLLPIKTKIAYFLITSSIVDRSEFYGTNGNIACMGLLSKNYQNSDFFFGFQSPITYYIQKDRTINSITTTLLNPDLSTPQNISPYSSVIYEVMRQDTTPLPPSVPLSQEQTIDWTIEQQVKMQQMKVENLGMIINSIIDDIIHPPQAHGLDVGYGITGLPPLQPMLDPGEIADYLDAVSQQTEVDEMAQAGVLPPEQMVMRRIEAESSGLGTMSLAQTFMSQQDPQPAHLPSVPDEPVGSVGTQAEQTEPKTPTAQTDPRDVGELLEQSLQATIPVADWDTSRGEHFRFPTRDNLIKGLVGHGFTTPYGYDRKRGAYDPTSRTFQIHREDYMERHGKYDKGKWIGKKSGFRKGAYPRGQVKAGEHTGRRMRTDRGYGGLLPPAEWITQYTPRFKELGLTPPSPADNRPPQPRQQVIKPPPPPADL
jgi:hypothetical protein